MANSSSPHITIDPAISYDLVKPHHIAADLQAIQKAILQQDNSQLDSKLISRLYSNGYSPHLVLYTLRGLLTENKASAPNKILSPDMVLLQALNGVRKNQDVILVALALRYEANTNMYVNDPQLGRVHVLVYALNRLQQHTTVPVINRCMACLIVSGANVTLPAFKNTQPNRPGIETVDTLLVKEWFEQRNYQDYEQMLGTEPGFTSKFITDIGVYLDSVNHTQQLPNLIMTIQSHADTVLQNWLNEYTNADLRAALKIALDNFNLTAFEILLTQRVAPDYVFINGLVIRLSSLYRDNDMLGFFQTRDILIAAVNHGADLDKYQLDYLQRTDPATAEAVTLAYQRPYWQKTCVNPLQQPDLRLRQIAFHLGLDIDTNRADLCTQIAQIASTDPDKVIAAATKRQEKRLAILLTNNADVVSNNNTVPKIRFNNESDIMPSPYQYNDVELAMYKDDQSNVWCFTANIFPDLIKSKINPYTGLMLPDNFLQNLQQRLDDLRYLGLRTREGAVNAIPISQALQQLQAIEQINNDNSQGEVDKLMKVLNLYRINGDELYNFSSTNLELFLAALAVPTQVAPLLPSHALATTAYVLNRQMNANPQYRASLATAINRNLQAHREQQKLLQQQQNIRSMRANSLRPRQSQANTSSSINSARVVHSPRAQIMNNNAYGNVIHQRANNITYDTQYGQNMAKQARSPAINPQRIQLVNAPISPVNYYTN